MSVIRPKSSGTHGVPPWVPICKEQGGLSHLFIYFAISPVTSIITLSFPTFLFYSFVCKRLSSMNSVDVATKWIFTFALCQISFLLLLWYLAGTSQGLLTLSHEMEFFAATFGRFCTISGFNQKLESFTCLLCFTLFLLNSVYNTTNQLLSSCIVVIKCTKMESEVFLLNILECNETILEVLFFCRMGFSSLHILSERCVSSFRFLFMFLNDPILFFIIIPFFSAIVYGEVLVKFISIVSTYSTVLTWSSHNLVIFFELFSLRWVLQ